MLGILLHLMGLRLIVLTDENFLGLVWLLVGAVLVLADASKPCVSRATTRLRDLPLAIRFAARVSL
jgi:hypothetical protein